MSKRLTADDICSILEDDDEVLSSKVYLCPPENPLLSDEDSADEEPAAKAVNNLSGNQLRAVSHVTMKKNVAGEIITLSLGDDEESSFDVDKVPVLQPVLHQLPPSHPLPPPSPTSTAVPSTSSETASVSRPEARTRTRTQSQKRKPSATTNTEPRPPPTKQRRIVQETQWVRNVDLPSQPEKEWELPPFVCSKMTPVELFELFFDREVIDLIVNSSNQYASEKGDMRFSVTPNEIKSFLAILLLSGYNTLPRYRMYWEESPDSYNAAVSNAMSRNRFEQIMKYLHVCNNNILDESDRFAKVTPLYNILNKKWSTHYNNEISISIDESMIPYYGRHGAKQHMHGKPIRFGYKSWCCCSRLGYLIQAIPYQGASTGNTHPELGVGGSVVVDLVQKLPQNPNGYNVYIDNFFTSLPLLKDLKGKGHNVTGTIRANRVEKAPLLDAKEVKKKPRGFHEQLTDPSSGVTLIRYNDNNVVTVASTQAGVAPMSSTRRWSKAVNKDIWVDQPCAIRNYNMYMGGVDRLDENIANLRINIRSKKWYWPLIAFTINASVNNAWLLYRLSPGYVEESLDLLGFTRRIVIYYLQTCSCKSSLGRPSIKLVPSTRPVDKRVTVEIRFDGINHHIVKAPKQNRCGQCKKNTTKMCSKCLVPLHNNCSLLFHTKNIV